MKNKTNHHWRQKFLKFLSLFDFGLRFVAGQQKFSGTKAVPSKQKKFKEKELKENQC